MGGVKAGAGPYNAMMNQHMILQVPPAASSLSSPLHFPFPRNFRDAFETLIVLTTLTCQALSQQINAGSMRAGFPFAGGMGQQP